MGEGIVEKLKREFDLSVGWRGVEIHPETPPGGRPLAELFSQDAIDRTMQNLRLAGAPFGIEFADRPFLSNSRPALLAAEFAREQGKFQPFHEAVFAAYFSQALDIGNLDILEQLAEYSGLDGHALREAVRNGRHYALLEEARQEAGLLGLSGVPTFVFNNTKIIVGAQPLDVFRKTLRSLE